ncbi:hypothetical protein HME9302_01675 [Alteripontixanthobacter maritimus]|uniref:JmjC domain-containing protein n=1 Tax=Alteripontixanthobacter maritimus TaxID=2161824 RepID=A0A369QDV9_9SPHN|nr:cupin-like domain-containing protein [Alteripontixanthobacter maritimus]RDC60468.1 hypothetical protein HME9302_01675 [Alteripontixanthobacter maritimus]
MNAVSPIIAEARTGRPVFSPAARATFAENYPEQPHILPHALARHDLLTLDALAELAGQLPPMSIEYNRGDLPIGVDDKPEATGLSIEDTIRHIAASNSWAVLKNIEQVPQYGGLLHGLLTELQTEIERATGAMLRPQGFVFISSPDAVTPFHFDPEHNILLQLRGSKVMTQFPAGDTRFVADEFHEQYHSGGPRELTWNDSFAEHGRPFALRPGEALYVPVMAPHFVRNGADSSVSLSITWRSDWSFNEADSRGMNRILRRLGFAPAAPGRFPQSNRPKALAYRALRKLGLTD